MQKRVYCLYRVSTTKQVDFNADNQADIPMQRTACHAFANKMGWAIIHEEQETGVSGFKLSADRRDKLQLIKQHAEQKKFDILLVFMFDRLGRRADETPFVVEWFVEHGIRVWSTQEGEQRFEAHVDHLINYIRYWQASGESQKIAIRTKTALGQLVLEGRFRGGMTPYGYRLEKSGILNKRKHEVNHLVIDDEEAEIVRMMFDLCVSSGYGKSRLARFLNDHGIRNRKGETWHDATIGAILHNPLYKGILRSGETHSEPFEELQIIRPELFDRTQELMTQRTNENRAYHRTLPLNTSGQSLLSGNVFCGHCGGRLTLTTNGKVYRKADGTPIKKKRIRYICYNKTRHRADCDGQTGYTMHILDGIVDEIVKKALEQMGPVETSQITNMLQSHSEMATHQKIQNAQATLRTAQKEYSSVKAEIMRSLKGESSFSVEILCEMSKDAKKKLRNAEKHLAKLRLEAALSQDQAEMNQVKDLNWRSLFEQSDMPVKKMITSYLVQKIYVFRDYAIYIEGNSILSL